MKTDRNDHSEARRKFVVALQSLVHEERACGGLTERLAAGTSAAIKEAGVTTVELSAHSDGGDDGTLRVLEPATSTAAVKIGRDLEPQTVDFYLTRPASDGTVETRLLGSAKHPNSDGSWSVRFSTDRFAVKPDDPLVLHAEVFGPDGLLAAVAAHMPVC
jgi:hypothetical protein